MQTSIQKVIPVILSGGSGTRLWPLSRKVYPKQLLNLMGGEYTLLQQTALRVKQLQPPIIVCNNDHRFMVAEQMSAISDVPHSIILEPVARNTAPAIAIAALHALTQADDAVIAVFPADHVIEDQEAFEQSLLQAVEAAASDRLVTFGIKPTKAETGYGYIKAIAVQAAIAEVECFVEKPDLNTAQAYVASGDYYWNSGMFVFKASTYLAALNKFNPEIVTHCRQALAGAVTDLDFIRIDELAFQQSPDDSIDYAVMERAGNVDVVPMDAGWSDIGSWSSLWEITDKDENNNAFIGDVISIDCKNTLVHNADKLVATIGLENVVVVDTPDALLIADMNKVQQVKTVVEQLKAQQRSQHLLHREVHRPWGSYDAIDSGNRYQVKRIKVKPGASLSLQLHHHRAEHWIVVKGTADVQLGDNNRLVTENESVYIPIGVKHRLTNPGTLLLELIEVQSGSYLGEDDIVRFEDLYQRE
jgi:mannose-1-phosphate guanylyltransferase/mannose-6-phosphate isomerase